MYTALRVSSHSDSIVASGSPPTDFLLENHGSIFLLQSLSPAPNSWIEESLPENHPNFGHAVVVEHRYIVDIVRGAMADGLVVTSPDLWTAITSAQDAVGLEP
jgi:hypothetical protein